jgi:hypothetical protein
VCIAKGVRLAEQHPVVIQIPATGFSDLAAVADHADKLPEIISGINQSQGQTDLAKMARFVSDRVGLPTGTAQDILDGLASMRGLMDRWKLSAKELVDSIERSIQRQASEGWKSQYLKKWEDGKDKIASALKSISPESPISIRQKVRELTYAHQNVLTDAALITDLRPVYNSNADKILAMVLTHVLSVSYYDGSRQQRIEFALDAADVAKISNLVARAKRKTRAAKQAFQDQPWSLMIAGTAGNDNGDQK